AAASSPCSARSPVNPTVRSTPCSATSVAHAAGSGGRVAVNRNGSSANHGPDAAYTRPIARCHQLSSATRGCATATSTAPTTVHAAPCTIRRALVVTDPGQAQPEPSAVEPRVHVKREVGVVVDRGADRVGPDRALGRERQRSISDQVVGTAAEEQRRNAW